MSAALNLKTLGMPAIVIAIVFAVASGLMLSPAGMRDPALARAALADLLITGPVLFLIFAYVRQLPLILVVPVANIGLELAMLTAPVDLHLWIHRAIWVSYPLMAVVIARAAALGIRQLRLAYPAVAGIPDPRDRMGALLERSFGAAPSTAMMASDLSFLRYAIWPPRIVHHGPGRFSGHLRSGLVPLLWAMVAIIVLETMVLHILVHLAAPVLAWILTALSLYSLMSLIGHIRALPRRYSTLEDRGVTLRAGLFGQCHIPYCQIAEVTPIAMGSRIPDGSVQLGLLGSMEPHNILLQLHHPARILLTHGITREAHHIVMHVDDPKGFADAVLQMRNRQNR